jgi:thiamine biosynthesis lipoprotein
MLKRLGLAAGGLAFILYFLRPPGPVEPARQDRLLLGTLVTIKLYGDQEALEPHFAAAFARIGRLDSLLSRHRPDSELRYLERAALDSGVACSPEMLEVLGRSQYFARRTGGALDITIGALTGLWNFPDAQALPDSASLDSARALVGYQYLYIDGDRVRILQPGLRLDLGAAGKGYAVDEAVAVLQQRGLEAGLVDAGGNLRYWGEKPDGRPWRFGVQHPRQPENYLEVEDLGLPAMATSGDYQQYFEQEGRRYHHILDPATGYPAQASVSATVWAATALEADILSTAVFVLGPERGLELVEELPGVEALVFFARDGRLQHRASSGAAGRFRFVE